MVMVESSLGQARDSKRFYYGWYMVGAGASLQFLLAGLMTQSFGAYVAVLQAERGWSKTALSGAAALQQMEAAILGPLLGWLIDRFGPQGIIRFGIFVFGCGLMLLSQTDSLLAFYGAFLVIAVGASCARRRYVARAARRAPSSNRRSSVARIRAGALRTRRARSRALQCRSPR